MHRVMLVHAEAVCAGSCLLLSRTLPHRNTRKHVICGLQAVAANQHEHCLQTSGTSEVHVHLQHVQGKHLGGP